MLNYRMDKPEPAGGYDWLARVQVKVPCVVWTVNDEGMREKVLRASALDE